MRHHLHLGLLPLLALLAACSNTVEGNGVYAERTYDVSSGLPPFSRATIGFTGDVDVGGHPPGASLFAGAAVRKVVLSGDENVIEHIQVQVDATGALVTTIDVDGYTSVHPPQLLVQAPGLTAVRSQGGADVTVHDAPAGPFTVTAVERGHVILEGQGGALEATLSDGSQLDGSAYEVTSAHLVLSGTSRACVWPEQPVTGSAADGSTVLVKGGAACEVALTGGSSCGPLQ